MYIHAAGDNYCKSLHFRCISLTVWGPLKSSDKSKVLLLNFKCLFLSGIFALQITGFFLLFFRDYCNFHSTHYAVAYSENMALTWPPPVCHCPSDLLAQAANSGSISTLRGRLCRVCKGQTQGEWPELVEGRRRGEKGEVTSKSRRPSPFIFLSAIWGDINVCFENLLDLCW